MDLAINKIIDLLSARDDLTENLYLDDQKSKDNMFTETVVHHFSPTFLFYRGVRLSLVLVSTTDTADPRGR